MFIMLLTLILIFGVGGLTFFRVQSRKNRIGGAISQAKALWLTYVLFNYFGVSLYFLQSLSKATIGYNGLLIFTVLIILRSLIQLIMMFGLRNWRPPYGIFSNLLVAIFMVSFLVWEFFSYEMIEIKDYVLLLFLAKLTIILLCDSYYALAFYKIVGDKTTGDQALWFANSQDVRFQFINKLTYRLNFIFSLLTAAFLIMTFIAYG